MFRRVPFAVVVALALATALAGCGGEPAATDVSGLTLPLPSPPDTLLPPPDDTQPPDVTDSIPADAMFGGDVCTALEPDDFAGLGDVEDGGALSADSCEWTLDDGTVVVQLASADQFAQPATSNEEIAPIDGVGLDAIGVDLGDRYRIFVQVENGYFSVTAPTRRIAERLAADAAERSLPGL